MYDFSLVGIEIFGYWCEQQSKNFKSSPNHWGKYFQNEKDNVLNNFGVIGIVPPKKEVSKILGDPSECLRVYKLKQLKKRMAVLTTIENLFWYTSRRWILFKRCNIIGKYVN